MNTAKTGEFIAALRKEAGLTQAQFAEKVHVSDKAVSRWETGRGMPDISNIETVAECLGVSVAELIRGEKIEKEISKEEIDSITAKGLSLTESTIRNKKYFNMFMGFLLGLLIVSAAAIHLASPVYLSDTDAELRIEELSDGRLIAVAGSKASGYDFGIVNEPDSGRSQAFISCYTTAWDRFRGREGESFILIGSKDDVDEVYYYPAEGGDKLLYGAKDPEDLGGVMTLPRLVYNYWLIIGVILTAAGFTVYAVCRRKYYARKVLNAALLPLAFTISIPVCLMGRFTEVYNASYHLSGILLMTCVLYAVLRTGVTLVSDRRAVMV